MPRPPTPSAACKAKPQELGPAETESAATKTAPTATAREAGDGRAAFMRDAPNFATATLTTIGAAEHGVPNVLSIAQRPDRLLEGELYAASSRLDWRTLQKRTFEVDLRVCVRCGGRLTVRAAVTDPATVAKNLDALRRTRAPPAAA